MKIQDGVIVDGVLYEAINRQMSQGEPSPCKQCGLDYGCGVLCTSMILDCDYFKRIGRVSDINVQPTNTKSDEKGTDAQSNR